MSLITVVPNFFITMFTIQSNEVPNSSWCEHEGLLRLERFLASKNLDLDVIITDRNRQNAAYIRRNMTPKGTKHYYDIWHIAKGK